MIRILASVAFTVLAAVAALPAQAQPGAGDAIWVPPELLDETREVNDDEISFCLNTASVLVDLDRAVAQAIGDALLLDVTFHETKTPFKVAQFDFRIPLTERELFLAMNNDCDAFIGIRLSPGRTPDWMTISQPYYRSRVLFASTNEAYRSFADVPAGEKIGSRLGAPGDAVFTSYLRSLPQGQRPQRVPYPDNKTLLDRLQDGAVSTIFIWELAPYFASGGDVAAMGFKSSFEPPFAIQQLEFGVAFLRQDTYMRGLVDEAISALAADGTIAALAEEAGIPVSPLD